MRILTSLLFVICFVFSAGAGDDDTIKRLEDWLGKQVVGRGVIGDQAFGDELISKKEASLAQGVLWRDYVSGHRVGLGAELKAKQIKIGEQTMRFDYRVFGKDAPRGGRSLYISMHGGGGGPARMNDGQWRNQVRLYEPKEGVYLAPRAPGNTWDLWHKDFIDDFFDRIIQIGVIEMGVNPDKVYVMGYSAGGDGAYQLAPRMADRWAAASMMAGHPGDARAENLRNIGFTVQVGGNDKAYKRNMLAGKWGKMLRKLEKKNRGDYKHFVKVYKGKGHWMDRVDRVAVPWMAKMKRRTYPERVTWVQDNRLHSRFYWLAVDVQDVKAGSFLDVKRKGQVFTILKAEDVDRFRIRLNDEIVDLDKEVVVKYKRKIIFKGIVTRTVGLMYQTIEERGDSRGCFSGEIEVDLKKKPVK